SGSRRAIHVQLRGGIGYPYADVSGRINRHTGPAIVDEEIQPMIADGSEPAATPGDVRAEANVAVGVLDSVEGRENGQFSGRCAGADTDIARIGEREVVQHRAAARAGISGCPKHVESRI